MKSERKRLIILYGLAIVPLIVTLILYQKMPEKIPMHFDINGNVDRMGDKFPFAFLMPLLTLIVLFLMNLTPKFDPKKSNYKMFKGSYYWFQLCFVLVFDCINIIVDMKALGYDVIKVDVAVKLLVGIMIAVIGNMMPKFKHNYFIGIKTPWTLADEKVWFVTHRMGGILWFLCGLAMIVLAFIPGVISAVLYFSVIVIEAVVPLIYSYFVFKRLQQNI